MKEQMRKGKILIIDDTPQIIQMVSSVLEQEGYLVSAATDGRKAINRAELIKPDLILLDVLMPGIDGYETCNQLKKRENLKDIPVLFMSALSETVDKVKGFKSGAVDYIIKPIDAVELLARVRAHLAIHFLQRELQDANELLEEKVLERTTELMESNKSLQKEIKEHQKAEKELKENEEKYRSLFEFSRDGICIISMDRQLLDANQQFLKLTGFTKDELLSLKLKDIFPFTPTSESEARINKMLQGEEIGLFEAFLQSKNGDEVPVEISVTKLENCYAKDFVFQGNVRDLTERKLAEEALRESERFSSILLDNSPTPILVVNQDTTIKHINPAFEELTGYSTTEVYGKKAPHPWWINDPRSANINERKESILKGTPKREKLFRKKSGEDFWVETITTPIKQDGKFQHALTTWIDITKRKLGEEKIRESETKLRTIFNQTYQLMGLLSLEGILLDVNKTALEVAGVDKAEVIGKPFWETAWWTHSPEEQKKLRKAIEKAGAGDSVHFETTHVDNSGAVRSLDFTLKPILDSDGKVLFLNPESRDITELKRNDKIMGARLRLSELSVALPMDEFLQSVLDETEMLTESSIGFFHFVEPDQETISIRMWSNNTLDGMCNAEGKGRHYPISKAGVWVDCIREERTVIHNDYKNLPHRKGLPQGHAPIIRELVAPVFREGKIVAVLGVGNKEREYDEEDIRIVESIADMAWDIVQKRRAEEEMKKLEDQLSQAQKMESIGTLAGGIAHDFNNILGAILINAELSLEDVKDNKTVKSRLEKILQSSLRASDLTKQILTFSRVSDKEMSAVNVTPIIKEVLKLLRSTLPTTIEINEHIETKADRIFGDPTQIHQVLMNLCTNAKHAMRKKGGLLEVALKDVFLESESEIKLLNLNQGYYLKLVVKDTGHGIPDNIKEKIFDPYFTTKAKGEGTGLGLSVIHGIVKAHGGVINVTSEEGKGTTFEAYFPILKDPQEVEPEQVKTSLGENERILFVDDERTLVEGYTNVLTRLGYQVVGKTSSVEALEIFREQPDRFDLVLTDFTMPHMTGIQLAEELLKIRPDLPVIIHSGFTEDITPEDAKKRGVREMVSKPLSLAELSAALRRCLG